MSIGRWPIWATIMRAYFSQVISFCLLVVAAVALTSCSLAPMITRNSLDYNDTIEDVSNQSLVTNVLRGRDNAPLYFPDLSQIRGAISATASAQASLPYGPTFGSVQSGPFSASSAPTFDIAPTNTKKFYRGILTPISKDIFAYYIEKTRVASDFRPTFYLLVNAIEETDTHRVIPWDSSEFAKLSTSWLKASPIVIQTGRVPSDLGPPVKADAKSIIDANGAGLTIRSSGGMMQLGKKTLGTAICFRGARGGYFSVSFEENNIVKSPGESSGDDANIVTPANACSSLNTHLNASAKQQARYKLHLRSVEQIFYFLGAIVKDEQQYTHKLALPDGLPYAGCPLIPFYIRTEPETARFSVVYRGETFYVANDGVPVKCRIDVDHDRTLPMLAILNDLLNLSRDADEVPTTKAVQAVGTN